jgi:uncharacterized glyoxalase superfamily protein PhnB
MPSEGDVSVVPSGHSRISPWLISRDADSEVQFMNRVFGANERPHSRLVDAEGKIVHVEVELGDSVVMSSILSQAGPIYRLTLEST